MALSPIQDFQCCGWPAFAMLACALAGLLAGVVGLVLALARKRTAAIAVAVLATVFSGLALGGGFLGRAHVRRTVDGILSAVDPDVRPRLREQGYLEAGSCVTVGLQTGALPSVLAGLGLVLAFLRKPE